MKCYNCRAEQPTIATLCAKGSCTNEISMNEAVFCFAHQQSLVVQAAKLDELGEELIQTQVRVMVKLEE